jgi:hypothetical protein
VSIDAFAAALDTYESRFGMNWVPDINSEMLASDDVAGGMAAVMQEAVRNDTPQQSF